MNSLKLVEDVKLLKHRVEKYLTIIGKGYTAYQDYEFPVLWKDYSTLRRELIKLNSELFNELKEIVLEKPVKLEPENPYEEEKYHITVHLNPLLNEVTKAEKYLATYLTSTNNSNELLNPISILEIISDKFHVFSNELSKRYANRDTIIIEDEYDVQDLFRALLTLWFDDVRPEEVAPSYAGKSARVDFLLKNEKIVIEIKKTRKGLDAKKLGEELIIDISRYQSHPDCNFLFCFVFDPEELINNPRGLESDLSNARDGFQVKVKIKS